MLAKLRRSSSTHPQSSQKHLAEQGTEQPKALQKLKRSSRRLSLTRSDNASVIKESRTTKSTTTFFDLPPEIRNVIYVYIACDATISIPSARAKAPKTPPCLYGLLLASIQTRQEFLPLLLEKASIDFAVEALDFSHIKRICASLYSTELKALQKNRRIHILIYLGLCKDRSIDSLRRWIVNRSENLYTVPFSYHVIWPEGLRAMERGRKMAEYRRRQVLLKQNLEAVSKLYYKCPDTLQFELQPIVVAMEADLDEANVYVNQFCA